MSGRRARPRSRTPRPSGRRASGRERSVIVTDAITGRRDAAHLEGLLDREEGGLRVEGVEGRLDEQEVRAAVEEARAPARGRPPRARRRSPRGPRGRSRPARSRAVLLVGPSAPATQHDRPGSRPSHRPRLPARAPGGRDVDVVDERLGAVVGLGDARLPLNGVRLDDVGPGGKVLAGGRPRRRRAGSGSAARGSPLTSRVPVAQRAPAVFLLGQPARLQQGPHRPVDDEDPPLQLTQAARRTAGRGLESPQPCSLAGRLPIAARCQAPRRSPIALSRRLRRLCRPPRCHPEELQPSRARRGRNLGGSLSPSGMTEDQAVSAGVSVGGVTVGGVGEGSGGGAES